VKDSGNQHTIKQHADGDITCNTHWSIQCSRMLKYRSIVNIYSMRTVTNIRKRSVLLNRWHSWNNLESYQKSQPRTVTAIQFSSSLNLLSKKKARWHFTKWERFNIIMLIQCVFQAFWKWKTCKMINVTQSWHVTPGPLNCFQSWMNITLLLYSHNNGITRNLYTSEKRTMMETQYHWASSMITE
jgi:hypothetical protein